MEPLAATLDPFRTVSLGSPLNRGSDSLLDLATFNKNMLLGGRIVDDE
jgi:hypothetical protein